MLFYIDLFTMLASSEKAYMNSKVIKKVKRKDRKTLNMGVTDKMGSTKKTNPTFSGDDSSGVSSLSNESKYQTYLR